MISFFKNLSRTKISSASLRDCSQPDDIRARARDQGNPQAPDSDDTADDAGDSQANVYTLIGLPMHSCALHHRGRKYHLAGLQSRPDGLR